MRLVIEFDCRDDAGVLRADYKVVAHSINAIVPFVKIGALLYSEDTGNLNLSKDDVLG